MEQLEKRVEDLEMKLAFQDETLEDLNQQVIKLNDLLSDQQQAIRQLLSKQQTAEPGNMVSQLDEAPPHY
ncbi:SlyX family protein [Shewanella violacea]|uniref:Protein SlyX homolog n=1 Tax=Shewanella violacea (strain JCM 10179 / CIP 106290 / LMG 19151 / DSS12) TaxID=637905 RepID=D4ZGC9_SHEVD|nr:SlyX family protein [Shewanella violacea]BAJ00728.1 slyX protein [Shewanella violacea DSS12]